MVAAFSSATGGVYRLISRCAVLGASPIWRVNTSSTHARQIHFSSCVTDSAGSADTSSGVEPILARAGFFLAATFVTGAFRLVERFGLGVAGILHMKPRCSNSGASSASGQADGLGA